MYNLFQTYSGKEYGILRLPEWAQYRDALRRNLATLIQFYNNTSYTVAPDHLLVRILQSIMLGQKMDTERYYANLVPLALTLASPFSLTSPINTGRVFNGVFYGKGNQEVIVAIDDYFDPLVAQKNWKSLTPVRVLRHPFTDLMLNVPNGQTKSIEQGVCVITVNIPMLAVQYRAFCQEEKLRVDSGATDAQRNVMQYVAMYALPGMLFTHLDQALFNRINHLWNNFPIHQGRSYHPMHLTNYSQQISGMQLRMIEQLKRSGYNFAQTLAYIPGAVQNDMEKAMLVPDVVPTRQVLWALVLARLPALLFLFNTAKNGAKIRDQKEVDQIAETFLQLKRQRVFETSLPSELYKSTMTMIDKIVTMTNNPKTN